MAPSNWIQGVSNAPLLLGLHVILCLASPCGARADSGGADHEALKADSEAFFSDRVTPFIENYCISCHQNRRPTQAGVNFSPALKDPSHAAFHDQWKRAVARVKAHDMPPKGAPQPSDADRRMFVDWITKLKYLSEKDPGRFVIRRLTKTEYGNTLHDLFGVEPSIADGLPDEVSGEGYLNSHRLSSRAYLTTLIGMDRLWRRRRPATESRTGLFGGLPRQGTGPKAARGSPGPLLRRLFAGLNRDGWTWWKRSVGKQTTALRAIIHLMSRLPVSPSFFLLRLETESSTGNRSWADYQLARACLLLGHIAVRAEPSRIARCEQRSEAQVSDCCRIRQLPRLLDGFGAQCLGVGGSEPV